MAPGNPYDWQSHHPEVEIPREDLDRVAETLRGGGGAVVLGGRGMGKSVFLQQLRRKLEDDDGTRVILISSPPAALTIEACLGQLARRLEVAEDDYFNSAEILEKYFAGEGAASRLVLLFDEFDRYAERLDAKPSNPPGRGFFNDLEASRRDFRELGVMATGSLGVYVVRDVLGSSFWSRALHVRLKPFDPAMAEVLAGPFVDRGGPLSAEVLDALHLATGGIPALLTFGLQQMWTREVPPHERTVTEVFANFRRDHGQYLKDLVRSVADPAFSEAPYRVLERIRQSSGSVPRVELEEARRVPAAPLSLDLDDILRLLEAAGLVRIAGSIDADDPLLVHAVNSLLDLPVLESPTPGMPSGERFLHDLEALLTKLHRASADFFRPGRDRSGRGGEGKQLVPESVFAAHLALGFELLGWRVEREAQSAAGRTDLKLRRNGSPDVMLVEVKIHGRNDYREAQKQIESYWTEDVTHGAVVEITDAENVMDCPARYRGEFLDRPGLEVRQHELSGVPIEARFACVSSVSGMTVRIDHYLARLSRRLS